MPFAAVLDASVLYPLPLRDTLLRIAETELYDAYWSERILDEVVRNLVADRRASREQAQRLTDAMTGAFDGAAVPRAAIDRLVPSMTNHPKDRHVLAAAVAGNAQVIVTLNLKDFPPEACEPLAIEPLHPDTFLMDLFGLYDQMVYEAVVRQAARLRRPPMRLDELLDRLAVTVPTFVQTLSRDLRSVAEDPPPQDPAERSCVGPAASAARAAKVAPTNQREDPRDRSNGPGA